jgi:hypothetical protein
VSENRVLRRIFGSQRDEVTGEWRKLHNEEINDSVLLTQYFSAIKSRRMRWVENVEYTGERRSAYRVSVRKPEGKRLLGRPWSRWEDNIKVNLKEVGCEGMDLIYLIQEKDSFWALVNAVMNLRVS